MAAPSTPDLRSDGRPAGNLPSNFLAPAVSRDDIALAFDGVLQRQAAAEAGQPVPAAAPQLTPQAAQAAQVAPAAPAPAFSLAAPIPAAPEAGPYGTDYPDPFAPSPPQSVPTAAAVASPADVIPDTNEGQAPETPESAPPVGDEGGIRTMHQLATAFGVEEPVLLQSLQIKTGDGNDVPLSAVIAGYLANPEAEQVALQRLTLDQENDTYRSELRATHDEALLRTAHLAQTLHTQLLGAQPSPEEARRMQAEDPDQWNAKRVELMERERALGESLRQLEEEGQRRSGEESRSNQEWLNKQAEEVMDIFPDLKNPATMTQQRTAINSYLGGIGFNSTEIQELADSRMYRVIRDALYGSHVRKRASQNIAAARDKGLPAPTPAAGGRLEQPGEGQLRSERLTALREEHRSAGSVDSAAAYFKEMGVQ